MAKMIQIRHVPDGIHRILKARAAEMGLSLSEYLLQEAQQAAELPTVAELTDRIRRRTSPRTRRSSASIIRRHRDAL